MDTSSFCVQSQKTAVAQISNPNNNKTSKHKCRLVLDCGSQRSYITVRAASKLQLLPDNEDRLLVFTFGETIPKEMPSPSVEIVLETKRGTKKQVRVNIVPHITEKLPIAKFDHSRVDLAADDDSIGENVNLLIGNDYYEGFRRQEKIQLKDNLYLIDTDFGWLYSGDENRKRHTPENILTVTTYCHCHSSSCPYFTEPDLPLRNIDIKFLWSLECIGINDSPKATRQEEAVKHFNDTIQYNNGRYEVTWPWIEYPPQLPVNFGMALGRLKSLVSRLDSATLQEYDDILKEQLNGNVIEIVEPHRNDTEHPVHYLAHHIVKNEGKRGRIVYDASMRSMDKKSLNECLYSGPSMLEDLTALLLKFRTKKIAIVADVEKAFLQVGLQEKDRDVTRFLWAKDITKDLTGDNLLYLRFCRVPFGIISSPFLLTATIRYHMSQTDGNLLKDIANNCYVDNLVTGANSVKEAQEIYEKTRETFGQISMNIRDWLSNNKEFLDLVPSEQQAKHENTVKILGLSWNVKRDTVKLRITDQHFDKDAPVNTKRKVLRTLARIYDPCGFICPLTLPLKVLFRSTCDQKHKWDTNLPDDLVQSMQEILNVIKTAVNLELPRCVTNVNPELETTYQLHGFSDASKAGYAAVIYLTTRSNQGTSISFLMGKSRIAKGEDTSELHIPKLELLGLLIASRLLKYVRENLSLPISKEMLWTDSLVVHGWMRSDKLLPPFVSNRVEEIRKNQMGAELYYINTKMNPADVATRPDRWSQSKELWFNGPTFLKEDETMWPTDRYYMNHMTVLSVAEGLDQSGHSSIPETDDGPGNEPRTVEANDNQQMEIEDQIDQLTNNNLSDDIPEIYSVQDTPPSLNSAASTIAEIKKLQKLHFANEIAGKVTHLTRNLGLFLDVDGVLRCQGRMVNTTWNYDMKHPILLPRDCEFTKRIIKETHESNYHVGTTHTLSLIREKYWIPQGKRQVERVISRCQRCVKHGGGPYRLPTAPDLPTERVNYSTPFTYCGVDYFGPLYVNTPTGKQKRWVALFTCLAVRAIHLEIVNNLTAEECLLALRRFAATRNTPQRLYSDNATCFKLTSEVVSKPYCIEKGIEWRFIPQLAPWHGGFYERLIGVVKHSLKRTLEKHLLGDSKLLTVLKEVEAVVNSRPLTKIGTEVIHILRPADFLSLGKCLTLTPAMNSVCTVDSSKLQVNLIESWKKGLIILEEFKKIFMAQYLTSLRERYQNSPKQPRTVSDCEPKLGDIVQIKSDLKNRELWKVGKIAELIRSADGKHRVAKVKVGDSIMTRSVGHLYPLETETDDSPQTGATEEEQTAPPLDTPIEYLDLDAAPSASDSIQPPQTNPVPENHDEVVAAEEVMNVQESMMDTETSRSEEVTSNPDSILPGTRTKRDAAIRAREKILEWTRHLLTLLQ
ncbi:uncharacterized protein LOC134653232 [Cydia amplana]|uniref:uncharacterized protein LOC134653232 n=1 Tax=Cydia amplana TaxID=1869771 RepID=UPI002FE5ACB6